MYSRTRRAVFSLTVIMYMIFTAGCGPKLEEVTKSEVVKTEESAETQRPLFWVDSKPVTREAFDQFVQENITGSGYHGSQFDPDSSSFLQFLDAFLRYSVILMAGDELGIAEDSFYGNAVRTLDLTLLGRAYYHYLEETAPVDPETISRRIPDPWVQMRFRMKVFPDMAEAKMAREAMDTEEDFERINGIVPLGPKGKDTSDTDLLFKGSGFFDPFDDAYLFTLQEGDISRPVISGLGPAIVMVVERHEFSLEEQETYLADVRRDMSEKWAFERMREVEEEKGVTVFEDRVQESVAREIRGYPPSESIIMRVGDHNVSYRGFRYLVSVNLRELVRTTPESALGRVVAPQARPLGQNIALGLAAEDKRFLPVDPASIRLPAGQVQRKIRYDQSYLLLKNSQVVQIPDDEQVEEFYRSNPESFRQEKGVRFSYFFTPKRGALEPLLEQFRDGLSFDRLRMNLPDSMPGHQSAGKMKTVFSWESDGRFKDIKNKLYGMKVDEVAIIEGGMGFYLVKIVQQRPEGLIELKKVKDEIRKRLMEEGRSEAASRYIKGAVSRIEVNINKPGQEEMISPPLEYPETG